MKIICLPGGARLFRFKIITDLINMSLITESVYSFLLVDYKVILSYMLKITCISFVSISSF